MDKQENISLQTAFEINQTYEETFCVSDDVYRGFINVFHDANPLHTNSMYAVSKGFKNSVIHGNVLNGFLSYFIGECLPIKNVIIHSQEIQFKNPVYLNDTLQLRATVTGIFESVNAVEFKFRFEKQCTDSDLTTCKDSSIIIAKGKIQIGILQ